MLSLAKNDESDVISNLAEYITHLMCSFKCEKQINFITEDIESIFNLLYSVFNSSSIITGNGYSV